MSVWLYGRCATCVLTDRAYDSLCAFIADHWVDDIWHRHWGLVNLSAVRAGTTVGYDMARFPQRIKYGAISWDLRYGGPEIEEWGAGRESTKEDFNRWRLDHPYCF